MKFNWVVFLAFTIQFLSGCNLSSPEKKESNTPIAEVNSISLIRYTTSVATLNLKGILNIAKVSDYNTVEFYSDGTCAEPLIGKGIYQDFLKKGIQIEIPVSGTSKIYLKTNTLENCVFIKDYLVDRTPVPPSFVRFSPGSPTRESSTPLVYGSMAMDTYQVSLFSDSSCASQIGSGGISEFSNVGILVSLVSNHVNTIYARTTEPFGEKSACTFLANFKHTLLGPNPPVFTLANPSSPERTIDTPKIKGVLSTGSPTSVSLFSDSGCSLKVGAGSSSLFTTDGIEATVARDSVTSLYGKSFDSAGNPSICNFLTLFTHDSIVPSNPTFISANPISPTRLTIYPRIKGTALGDATTIKFFNGVSCMIEIGSGTKVEYEGSGILVGVMTNNTISIYAKTFDAAGNSSNCTFLTTYKNNTIAPDPPVFGTSLPISPNNQSITPTIFGAATADTVQVNFYQDDQCTISVGSGTGVGFDNPGIVITVPGNQNTTIYGTSRDFEGNISPCIYLTNYAHSTVPAPSPGVLYLNPSSPSRISVNPYIIGTAAATVSRVELYSDSLCSTSLGSASKLTYVTSGIRATVPANVNTSIYGKSQDVYGNFSPCVLLTNYVHCNAVPFVPTFSSVSPASPNNQSVTPLVQGTVTQNPASILPPSTVSIYDNFLCLNRLGTGPTTDFTGVGTSIGVPPNTITTLYGRSFDAAGNVSTCQYLADYTHDILKPGNPTFASALPATPSFYESPLIKGTIGNTTDFLPPQLVEFYSDSSCSFVLGSGSPASFQGSGIQLTLPTNATTSVYAAIYNGVGTTSNCTHLIDYVHKNTGPTGLVATQNLNGSVSLSWDIDSTSSPSPGYVIKRSLNSGGPYSILHPYNLGVNFIDRSVNSGTTYYYKVAATNITGTSQDSVETAITVTVGAPASAISLTATTGPSANTLVWTGFNSDLHFSVYRGTQSGGPYTLVKNQIFGSSYTDSTAVNNTAYFYVVVGVNPAGRSFYSNEVDVITLDVPPAPTSLTISPMVSNANCGGARGVNLTWVAPSYYSRFTIYKGNASGSENFFTQTGSNSYTDCSVNGGYEVWYQVSADWDTQTSPRSNEVGFYDQAEPTVTANSGNNQVYLNWPGLTYAVDYIVLRSNQAGGPYTILVSNFPGTNYQDLTAINGTAYYYRVIANYLNGLQGYPSFEMAATPGTNPSTLTNLTLSFSGLSPQLSWSPSANYNQFNIYRAATAGGPYSMISNSTLPVYIDGSPLAGFNYYKVTAQWGSFETAGSNIVSYRNGYPLTISAAATSTDIKVTWSGVTGATSYNIFRTTTSSSGYVLLSSAAVSPYTDATAVTGQGYYYVVSANFPGPSTGQKSVEVSGMRTTTNVPSGLTLVSTGSTSATLTWAKVNSASLYNLFKATAVGGPYTSAGSASVNNINISGLLTGTSYYFKATSVVSGSQSAQSAAIGPIPIYGASGTPTGIPGNNVIDISWGTAPGATSYSVQRSSDSVTFATIASGLSSSSYQDAGVVNGSIYFYRIIAVFPGTTITSGISLPLTPGTIPLIPQGITVTDNSTGTDLTFSWSPSMGANSYHLYQSNISGGPYTLALDTSSTILNVVSGLTPGATYYFVLTALTGTMESAVSNQIAVIPEVTPAAPVPVATSATQIDLSWSFVSGATVYDLFRSSDGVTFSILASGIAGNSYSDTSIAGLNYTYKYLPKKVSIPMAESSASGLVSTAFQPLAPTNLTAHSTATNSVTLVWVTVPLAAGYDIYRSTVSGGTYSYLGSVSSPTINYSDSTVVAGTTYYYVVKSKNSFGLTSNFSNEITIRLVAGPAGLSAATGTNSINLSWSAVGGATSYAVLRSYTMGGPYGVISSANPGTTYSDTQIRNGSTYYYVVDANFSSGAHSVHSNEAFNTAIDSMNIEVPIELIDRGLASSTTSMVFERSRTSLDTTKYDGTKTYNFEIVATNSNASPVTVNLVDAANIVVGTIAVPGSVATPTRYRNSFTPTPGVNSYRLVLSATIVDNELIVYSGRMLVKQLGATKTKIYIPLLSSSLPATSQDLGGFVEQTQSQAYSELPSASIYRRKVNNFSSLVDFNPWELETLSSASAGSYGTLILNNRTRSTPIIGTGGYINSVGISMHNSPFNDEISGFGAANENEDFEIGLRCEFACTTGRVSLYKAGLWVTLDSLSLVDIYYRIGLGQTGITLTTDNLTQRTLVDLTLFSNSTITFQTVGKVGAISDNADVYLMELTGDSGLAGLTAISAGLNFSLPVKSLEQNSPIVIPTGRRVVPQIQINAGQMHIIDSGIIINSHR